VLATAFFLLLFWRLEWKLAWAIPFHLAVFAVTALVLHRRLASARPPVEQLTEFYLWVALGGVLGGAFNALAAPVLFDSVVEYELVLVAACFLRPSSSGPRAGSALQRARRAAAVLLPALVVAAGPALGIVPSADMGSPAFWLITLVAGAGCLLLRRSAWRFGLALTAVLAAATALTGPAETVLYADRSFFGSYRVAVEEDPRSHLLYHGTTVHGAQLRAPGRRRLPTTYYHPAGPPGWVFDALGPGLEGAEITVVGLGTGSLLCHGRPDQRWTFYEIDPEVERIAADRELFSFLSDCGPSAEVETGDARLSLAREPADRFSVLVLDAFSSDAIPAHLLTREALAVYRRALAPGGVLLFHASNRYLDLEPVVGRLAIEQGLSGRFAAYDAASHEEERELAYSSEWIVLAERREDLGPLATDGRWRGLRGSDGPLWTDGHTAIVELFR
jgi:SAM-dependent methyltransferase